MLVFLSPEWIDALARAAAEARIDERVDLVIEQVVTGASGNVSYRLCMSGGRIEVEPGSVAGPALRFVSDRATARAIAAGEISAQRAFMAGDLRVGGDLRLLLENQDALGSVGDLFASVRARTDLA